MIVGHYIWSAGIGGIEKLTIELARTQIKNGITPHLLVGKNKGEWLSVVQQEFNYTCCNLSNGYFTSLQSLRIMRRFFAAVDVIHLHTFHPMVCWSAVHSGKPIVYHVHGNWASGRAEKITDKIKRYLLRYFLKNYAHTILFNSAYTQQRFSALFKLNNNTTRVIHNGCVAVAPINNQQASTKFIVGSCGRLASVKRMDRVLFAFTLFAKNKTDVQLTIVGDGPLMNELKLLAKHLNITNLLHLVGASNNVASELAQFTVAVLGSQGESFGLVAIECLQQNKPTLVYADGGGLTEIMQLVDAKNITNNDDDMSNLLNVYYLQWKANNLKFEFTPHWRNYFSIARFEKDIASIYTQVYSNDCSQKPLATK